MSDLERPGCCLKLWRFLVMLVFGPDKITEDLPRQGYSRAKQLVIDDWEKPTSGLLRLFRLTILAGLYLSLTVLADQFFILVSSCICCLFPGLRHHQLLRTTSRSALGVSREVLYHLPRDVFLIWVLFTPLHRHMWIECIVIYLMLDILHHLAGSALVWGKHSIDPQRSLIFAIVNYFEITTAFATLYLHFNCLTASSLVTDPTQAFYFSLSTATTIGDGNISFDEAWGRRLMMCQLSVFVIFVVVLFGILVSRASPSENGKSKMMPLQNRYRALQRRHFT
jgi:hypothetical protein